MKRGMIIVVALFLIVITLIMSVTAIDMVLKQVSLDERYQVVKLNILVESEDGMPLPMASILVFNLTERGSAHIITSYTDEFGRCLITLKIYRLHIGWTNVILDKKGKEVFKDVPAPVFIAHNIIIVAYKYPYHVMRALSLDPTFMRWPVDEVELKVVARRIFSEKTAVGSTYSTTQSVEYILIDSDNSWAYTNVVIFATWYNISAYARWDIGNKYEVETKQRISYDGVNWESWLSAGSTQITIDRLVETKSFTGNSEVIVKFEYEYRIERYHVIDWSTGEEWYEDWAFAIDHTTGILDPRSYDKVVNTWDGTKKGGNYVEIEQEDKSGIAIKGGIHWTFSVDVQFTLSIPPPTASISVTLGVTKVIAPYGYVYYSAGTWYPGYDVYVYDANTNWLKMYATWRTQP